MPLFLRLSALLFILLSTQVLAAEETFVSFDFEKGKIENGFDDWRYVDKNSNPCDVYNGQNQSKLCGPDGLKIYPYYNSANNNHIGWLRYGFIDGASTPSVSGSALKVQYTGGAYQAENGVMFEGIEARSKSDVSYVEAISLENSESKIQKFPGEIALYFKTKTNTTKFEALQNKNRLSVWILMPHRTLDIDDYKKSNINRPDQRIAWYPFINTSKGGHYYHHASNIPMGGWTKIQFDAHPTHHNSGAKNRYSAFNVGGYEYAGSDTNYFNNIATFAIRVHATANQPLMSYYYIDEITTDYVPYENEETINNLAIGYDPESDLFDISFEDKYRCRECNAKYEVRYSFEPITNANFDVASIPREVINFERAKSNTEGIIYKPEPGYNILWAAMRLQENDEKQLTPYQRVFFAVKDISSRSNITPQKSDEETVFVPDMGSVKKKDLIKTISYDTIPVTYPLFIPVPTLKDPIVDKPYSAKLSALGGVKPYRFEVSHLPPGLRMSDEGQIEGIPLLSGEFNIRLKVVDSTNSTQKRTFKVNVKSIKDFLTSHCGTIVDFSLRENEGRIQDARFNTVINDKYTGFIEDGATIITGKNKDYNYQGASGKGFVLNQGDIVRLIWKNKSDRTQEFAPRVSFVHDGRFTYKHTKDWRYASKVQIKPNDKAVSELLIEKTISSKFINVNVNKPNNRALFLERIEFLEKERSKEDVCIPYFL